MVPSVASRLLQSMPINARRSITESPRTSIEREYLPFALPMRPVADHLHLPAAGQRIISEARKGAVRDPKVRAAVKIIRLRSDSQDGIQNHVEDSSMRGHQIAGRGALQYRVQCMAA